MPIVTALANSSVELCENLFDLQRFFTGKTIRLESYLLALTFLNIPQKSFQMIRYYGWYSNRSRGMRLKQGIQRPGDKSPESDAAFEIIDVTEYQPKKIPSKTWRECIKKIYEVDPLCCPNCGGEMRIISFITEFAVILQILEHLGLWVIGGVSRDPPQEKILPDLVYEPFDDGWPGYEEPCIVMN